MVNHLHRLTLLLFWLFVLVLLVAVHPTSAQTAVSATLSPLQIDKFPRMTVYLGVRDAQGSFVHALQARDVRVMEDDRLLPVSELSEIHPGVQLVVAISPGPPFAIRDGLGNSRYSYLVEAFRAWTGADTGTATDTSVSFAAPIQIDDYNLIAAGIPEALNLSTKQDWFSAFESYQPEARTAVPSLDTLARALEIASVAAPHPGMGRAVLFITPPQASNVAVSLQDLAARANQQNIHIFVWFVAAPELFSSQSAVQLQNLATQTSGQFLAFSGAETIPNLEDILEPLRSVYTLSYDAQLSTSGTHQLIVEVNTKDLQVATPPRSFDVNVLPPNPIFVSPPSSILRSRPSEKTEAEADQKQASKAPGLVPTEQRLEVLIEFPDGYPRPIVRTILYVDGAVVVEKTTPPFEQLTWDISGYAVSGHHLIRVEVVDSLGLRGTSIDTGVQITVQQPRRSFLAAVSGQGVLLVGLTALMFGAVVAFIMIWGGRIRPRVYSQGEKSVVRRPASRAGVSRRRLDRFVHPAEIKGDTIARRLPRFGHLQWPLLRPSPKAPAFLVPFSESEEVPPSVPIAVTSNVIILGRDSLRATLVLDDPSVDDVHARLRQDNGSFWLVDEGSVAGTWVNFTPISREGILLEHGDLIQVGRIGFHFMLREPTRLRKPVVMLQE
jgi:hypothetical protein